MGATGVFIKIIAVLVIFNILFVIIGWNDTLISMSGILGTFAAIVVIGFFMSIIPTTSEGQFARWLVPTLIVLSVLYKFSFDISTWNISYGVGLATNLMNMFSSNSSTLAFMPWLFFTFLGIIGAITGIMGIGGGD